MQKNVEKRQARYPYSLLGQIASIDETGYASVHFSLAGKDYRFKSHTTIPLNPEHIGQQCVIVFNHGNIDEPIITGVIQPPRAIQTVSDADQPVVIQSETGIVLKCGASRIELSQDGTINIQGMHINNQAYGPNRIKGGSVKIN